MQSKFENQIRNALKNDSDSERYEPLPGHEERFEMRLLRKEQGTRMRRIPRLPVLVVAAASVIGVIVSIVVVEIKKTNATAEKVRLSDVSGEMALVEEYYHERLQAGFSTANVSDGNVVRFMDDIKRLEEEYKRLEETLAKNIHDERIAQAMVNNYKFRLKLMEQLQKYIEIQNKINVNDEADKLSS